MTSRIAQSPAACDVVIPLFSIGGFLSLLVISPDFSLDLARAYSTFKYVAGRDTAKEKSKMYYDKKIQPLVVKIGDNVFLLKGNK